MTMKGLELHGSDVADRTASTYDETMHEATGCQEKEAELYFLNSTLASSLYSCPALPPLLLNLSLSLSPSPCVSLSAHTLRCTHEEKQWKAGRETAAAQWGYSAYVGSEASGQQPLKACARVCECGCVCESVWGCVCEWVTLCRDRGENQRKAAVEESDFSLEEHRTAGCWCATTTPTNAAAALPACRCLPVLLTSTTVEPTQSPRL